jgi:siroheme synthase
MASSILYDDVVRVTYQYLGPAADRFVVRQIRNHLQKNPEELRRKDLRQLIDWIQLAMRLISNDAEVIDRYITELEALAQHKHAVLPNGRATHA